MDDPLLSTNAPGARTAPADVLPPVAWRPGATNDPNAQLDASHLSAITAETHVSPIAEDSVNEPNLHLAPEKPPTGADATPHLATDRGGILPPNID
jgi:hypothetical protein